MTFYITPFGRVIRHRGWVRPEQAAEWPETRSDVFVPVNVKASEDEFVITALLPGVKADDLSIQVVDEAVTLQGEIKAEGEENENYLLRETPTGRFYRTLNLPAALDSTKASADLNDGVLTLRVPKAEEARPRTIKVQAKLN